ncbi:MAG: TolC family protein [Phycisphaerae bacterium]|nr:TolC family protein [Phycisphaerae bacterium]
MQFRVSSVALIGATCLLGACQSPSHESTVVPRIRAASGSDALIEYRTESAPLDEPVAADALPLHLAVRSGLETDPALQAALARVRVAAADSDQARLLPNPVLNFILRWGPGKPQFEISLAQDFIEAIKMPKRISAADNRLREAAADALATALDAVAEIQVQYADTQAASELVPLLESRLALLDKLVAVSKDRLDIGEGTRQDLVTLQARRSEIAVDLEVAKLSDRQNRLRLARLIGEPSSQAAWTLDSLAIASPVPASENVWIASALEHRPELQSISWRLAALGDDLSLAKASIWDGASIGVDAQRDDEWFTGPSISTPLPIFDTGKARSDRAMAQIVEARHDLTLASRKAVEETRVALRTFSSSTQTLVHFETDLIPLERSRLDLARDAFDLGQIDTTTLYLAEQDLRIAQIREIETRRQVARSLAELQRAAGGPGISAPLLTSTVTPTESSK